RIGLEKNGLAEISSRRRRKGDSLDPTGGRGMHRHRDESAGFGNGLTADHFLTLAHDRDGRHSRVLRKRNDEQRSKRKPADSQVAGGVLKFGDVAPSREPPADPDARYRHAVRILVGRANY